MALKAVASIKSFILYMAQGFPALPVTVAPQTAVNHSDPAGCRN